MQAFASLPSTTLHIWKRHGGSSAVHRPGQRRATHVRSRCRRRWVSQTRRRLARASDASRCRTADHARVGDAGGPDRGHPPRLLPRAPRVPPTTVYDRYALAPGAAFDGPAIVQERESTLVIGPAGRFEVAESGNIIVSIG
jgi:N-methylhydantoinase A/oxoprolinase/acetone carboxylase beta subunit